VDFPTRAVHAGQQPDATTGAVIPPIVLSSTFAQETPGVHKGFEYSRTGNPTRQRLETALASLDGGRYGLAFASGNAAAGVVLKVLSPGDHVVAGSDLYGGTYRIFEQVLRRYGIDFSYANPNDSAAFAPQNNTRLIWVETPTNPLIQVSDISAIARQKGAALLVVDNTFASSYLQNPLELGADIVLYSSTKYLGGHSDIVGGALVCSDEAVYERLKFFQNAVGAVPSAFDCWLLQRSLKTLHLRMESHCDNAEAVAAFLQAHPKVERVYYPGISDHPGHAVAKRQMRRFGGMVSFELAGDLNAFFRALNLFTLAESLGGVESLACHPASMTHASIPAEVRLKNGVKDNLIRLSVGVESATDLVDDLDQALSRAP